MKKEVSRQTETGIELYEFKGARVRIIMKDGAPWFVAKDVAEILGYRNPNEAVQDHVEAVDKIHSSELNSKSLLYLGQRGGWLINESGLYGLILSSKLPSAKRFKKWVTSEVLPSIHKTGMYSQPQNRTEKLLLSIKLKDEVIEELEEENRELKTTVEVQQGRIEADKPKVELAERLLLSEDVVSLKTAAKLLKLPYGGTIFAEKLRDMRILMEHPRNIPFQKCINQGYFVVDDVIKHIKGNDVIFPTPKVTKKGIAWLSGIFKRKKEDIQDNRDYLL